MIKRTADGYPYPLLEPSFPVRAIARDKLSRAEARRQFDWLIDEAPERRRILIDAAVAGGMPRGKLDYTPGSLVPLWSWAIPNMQEERLSAEELDRRVAASPAWVRRANIKFGELSLLTKCLCIDIGLYLAEILMRRYSHLHWALWTKKIGPLNFEFVEGFPGAPFVPQHLVSACAWGVCKGNRDEHVLEASYHYWEGLLDET